MPCVPTGMGWLPAQVHSSGGVQVAVGGVNVMGWTAAAISYYQQWRSTYTGTAMFCVTGIIETGSSSADAFLTTAGGMRLQRLNLMETTNANPAADSANLYTRENVGNNIEFVCKYSDGSEDILGTGPVD
jgi:hypothetical protein